MISARRLIALCSALVLLPMIAVTAATASATAADGDALFRALPSFRQTTSAAARVQPTTYRAYRADLGAIRAQLSGAGAHAIAVPDPAGTPTTFTVVEDSVMEPELQAAHPEIRTYSGGDGNGSSIRLDVTPMGFHAFVRRADGVTWFVDPAYNRRDESRVLSYAGGSTGDDHTFLERELDQAVDSVEPLASGDGFSTPGGLVKQRVYRMAFVTDPSYAAYFGTENVMSEKATMMNRVNELYNDDLAIKFVLVDGTDTKLNLDTPEKATEPDGPCGASPCFSTLDLLTCNDPTLERNNFVAGMLIGADNFDIGHIGLGKNGGGIAGLGVVGTSDKAAGCTGLPQPDGDFYAIDYVAHEVGHQMGGNHTFNSQVCGSFRNGATSVEPGSGSSVMAYAGICGDDDLQPHTDPYFSQRTIDEINATTAATPAHNSEVQSVAFLDLDPGDQIVLSCAGCSSQTVPWTGSTGTDTAALTTAITTVTGATPVLSRYDGTGTIDADGFTASWVGGVDIKTLTAEPDAGSDFTAIVGTLVNGGPETNRGAVLLSTNHSPAVSAPVLGNKTIPTRTPFELTGSATDSDGDALTYLWEQNDRGDASAALQSDTKTDGPLFRQFGTAAIVSGTDTLEYHSPGENLAGTSPTRVFPDLEQILAGNTNAATGSCPASPTPPQTTTDCFSEFLPTADYLGFSADRALNFRLTARDTFSAPDGSNDNQAGGLSVANLKLTVDSDAGPFLVTSHATAGGTASGIETVTWAVNGTSTAALAQNVRISLSTNGGQTFPILLADSTPNDGSQAVVLPNLATITARLKVEAVGNYFFDINDADFEITPGSDQAPVVDAGPDATVIAGAAYSAAGSFSDEWPGSASATVDYGDGAGPQPLSLSGTTFALNHTYNTAGTKTVTVAVTDGVLTGTDTATVTVKPAPPLPPASSTVAALAKPKKVTKGLSFKVKATVTSTSGIPTGVVQVYAGSKRLGKGTLSNGKVKLKISKKKAKKLKVGKNTLTASYLGSATVAPSEVDFVVKVVKKES